MHSKFFLLVLLAMCLCGCNNIVALGPTPTPTLIFEITPRSGTRETIPTQVPPAKTRRPRPTRTRPSASSNAGTATPVAEPTTYADAEATMRARATASPFPTAPPAQIQNGKPAVVTAQRGGLTMRVEIPQDTLLAGEGARAEITFSNDGPDSLFFSGGPDTLSQIVLLDERGHGPAAFPWQRMSMPGESRFMELKPGDTYTETVLFNLPPRDQIGEHRFDLWGAARFSRVARENGNGPDNLWLQIEAGALPLQIKLPEAADELRAELAMDYTGWFLRVTDAQGNAVNPTWGYMEMRVSNPKGTLSGTGPLKPGADGTWKQRWDADHATPDSSFALRVWAAAPNHTIVTATKIITGSGDVTRVFRDYKPETQEFSSLDAAQNALGVPLARVKNLPAHAMLENVRAEISRYDQQQRIDTHQLFRVDDDTWLELTQFNNTEKYESAGWGQARYETDAQQVDVAGAGGYLIRRLGWWVLNWKRGEVGFELRAPVEKFSETQLLEIARGVEF